jgi:hypothetical protein
MNHAKSATEIITETGIAHTTEYRKNKWLVGVEILTIDRICLGHDGKKFCTYYSVIRSINIRYNINGILIEAVKNMIRTNAPNGEINLLKEEN